MDADVYCKLLRALATGDPAEFEKVRPLGLDGLPALTPDCSGGAPPLPPSGSTHQFDGRPTARDQRLLENPQSGLTFELEGKDPREFCLPPAPSFDDRTTAAEAAEVYWMALARDVPFARYRQSGIIAAAAADLSAPRFRDYLSPYFRRFAPYDWRNLFRGPTAGDQAGPYVSQFLLRDVPFGAQFIPAMIRTLVPGVDFMTAWDNWLEVQNGRDQDQTNCEETLRLPRSGRDLAQFVHVDRDYNAFVNACQLMLYGREPSRRCEARPGLGVPFGPCLPYRNPSAPAAEEFCGKSANQIGQGSFGDQHVKSVLVGATFRAFHAVWYQKWFVHRRLRPEEFGGRVHLDRIGKHAFAFDKTLYDSLLFTDELVLRHNERQDANRRAPPTDRLGRRSDAGTYLLPMAFAEGSPLHPSYGSGHSTVSGCLATLLKAFFDNDWAFPDPLEPNEDGTSTRAYRRRAGERPITVAGELDKLASNIGVGRIWAGVHWRSDHEESLLLGEQVAIAILCDQRNTFNEPYELRFRSFDFGPYGGKVVRIRPSLRYWDGDPQHCPPCVELLPPDRYRDDCERRRRPIKPRDT